MWCSVQAAHHCGNSLLFAGVQSAGHPSVQEQGAGPPPPLLPLPGLHQLSTLRQVHDPTLAPAPSPAPAPDPEL